MLFLAFGVPYLDFDCHVVLQNVDPNIFEVQPIRTSVFEVSTQPIEQGCFSALTEANQCQVDSGRAPLLATLLEAVMGRIIRL